MRHPASFAPGDTFAAAHLSTAASEDALSGLGAGGWQANNTHRASARGKEGSRLPLHFPPLDSPRGRTRLLGCRPGRGARSGGAAWLVLVVPCRTSREGCNRSTRQGSTRCSCFLDTKHAHTLPYPLMLDRDNRLRRWGGRRTENRQGETNHGLGAWLNVLPGANSHARRATSELPRASHPEAPLFVCGIVQTQCLRQTRPPRFSWRSDAGSSSGLFALPMCPSFGGEEEGSWPHDCWDPMASTPTQLPRMRLVYFDMPGRAEAIRLAFTIGACMSTNPDLPA